MYLSGPKFYCYRYGRANPRKALDISKKKRYTSSKAKMGVTPVYRRVFPQQIRVYLQHDPTGNIWI